MATRDELLAKLDLIEQNARTPDEAASIFRLRSTRLMFDADDTTRPNADDLSAVEHWIEQWKADVVSQQDQLGNVLGELGE